MYCQPQYTLKFSTVVSYEQLGALEHAFHRNVFPDQREIRELALRLHLDVTMVQMWFNCRGEEVLSWRGCDECNTSLAKFMVVTKMEGSSHNQAFPQRCASCIQAWQRRGAPTIQVRPRAVPTNLAMMVMDASSNQATPEMDASSNQATPEMDASSNQATPEMDASSSQAG